MLKMIGNNIVGQPLETTSKAHNIIMHSLDWQRLEGLRQSLDRRTKEK